MAFLENDGNIILDCVLTDTGRMRLARGEFEIVKFAVGDDEINYGLYDTSHASGSAYYGLAVEQSPVFEAFTDNAASMKSHLITIPNRKHLYLPISKLNEVSGQGTAMHTSDTFLVAVNKTTEDDFDNIDGVLLGENPRDKTFIRVDQGIDSTEIPPSIPLDPTLKETQYTIQIDNRLGMVVSQTDGSLAQISYVDDDNIAYYFLTLGTDPDYVLENTEIQVKNTEAIAGPRGTKLQFRLQASTQLNTSTYLFTKLGSTTNINNNDAVSTSCYYIDSIVRVRGETTGYILDIPVRWIRKA